MKTDHIKLDNPLGYSLHEVHQNKALKLEGLTFYDPNFCPFGASEVTPLNTRDLLAYHKLCGPFFLIGEKPIVDAKAIKCKELVCDQMVLPSRIDFTNDMEEEIVLLEQPEQRKDLFALVNLVQPGYFKKRTAELGKYFGIYKDHQLVAVCGERMKMNGYTEISAIVTHPDHLRKGYAKQLIIKTTHQVFDEGKIPYLHVVETNSSAIQLYKKLGFYRRRKISFWEFEGL